VNVIRSSQDEKEIEAEVPRSKLIGGRAKDIRLGCEYPMQMLDDRIKWMYPVGRRRVDIVIPDIEEVPEKGRAQLYDIRILSTTSDTMEQKKVLRVNTDEEDYVTGNGQEVVASLSCISININDDTHPIYVRNEDSVMPGARARRRKKVIAVGIALLAVSVFVVPNWHP